MTRPMLFKEKNGERERNTCKESVSFSHNLPPVLLHFCMSFLLRHGIISFHFNFSQNVYIFISISYREVKVDRDRNGKFRQSQFFKIRSKKEKLHNYSPPKFQCFQFLLKFLSTHFLQKDYTDAFGDFRICCSSYLKMIRLKKKKKNMLLQSPLIFYLCVYFLVLGVMAPLDILTVERMFFFLLKGQRLGYGFSQKCGNNLTSLQNLSTLSCQIYFSTSALMPP